MNKIAISTLAFILIGLFSPTVLSSKIIKYKSIRRAYLPDTIPLIELGLNLWKTFPGGLYPNGLNKRPFQHEKDGQELSKNLIALDSFGQADPINGKIVLLSIGMSNATQEFSAFKMLADTFRNKNPKVLVGYSDITALHHAFYKEAGLKTYHGPVASSQIFSAFTADNLRQVFFSDQKEVEILSHEQEDETYRQPALTLYSGQAEGRLMGGNLTLLAAMAGTSFAPSYKNKMVFMEEIGEKPYRIDRMFTQLMQATDIKKARGIIFGLFHDCQPKPEENSFTLMETIQDFVEKVKIPAIYGFPIGHVPDMVTLPMDAFATLDADHNSVVYKR